MKVDIRSESASKWWLGVDVKRTSGKVIFFFSGSVEKVKFDIKSESAKVIFSFLGNNAEK